MVRYQHPNPLDLLFFAGELATRRAGLPGVHVHLNLVLRGPVDLDGLRRAVRALCRTYPTLAARRTVNLLTGRPRWRLDRSAADGERIVQLHRLEAGATEGVQAAVEALFNRPTDTQAPPLRIHVFRGQPEGDLVVLRWPHALMDGRGGFLVVEELARLYETRPDLAGLTSVGDERRDDFQRLIADRPLFARVRMLLDLPKTVRAQCVLRWVPAASSGPPGKLYFVPRSLSAEETAQVLANMQRVAGASPSADYLRACGLHALHGLRSGPRPASAVYTTMALVDNRRHNGPALCWNLNTVLPIVVPAAVAGDVPALTRLIRQQMIAHIRHRFIQRYWAMLALATRAPSAWLAAFLRTQMLSPRATRAGFLLTRPPSLRMDFIGPLTRPVSNFCGAGLENYYGYATLLPTPGFALHVNLTHQRLNVTGVGFEKRVPRAMLTALVERFLTTLLQPAPP